WSGSYGRCLFTTSQQHSSRTAPKRVRRGEKLKGQNFDGGTSRPLGIPPQRHAGSSGEGGGLGAQAARAQRGDGPTGSAGGLYLGVGEAALRTDQHVDGGGRTVGAEVLGEGVVGLGLLVAQQAQVGVGSVEDGFQRLRIGEADKAAAPALLH